MPQYTVLGLSLTASNADDVWRDVADTVRSGKRGGYLVFANAHLTVEAARSSLYRTAVRGSYQVLPDSTPLFWIARRRGLALKKRVYGPDFMRMALDRSKDGRIRHFLYGGTDELLGLLRKRIEETYPGVRICGTLAPPFRDLTDEEIAAHAARVNEAKPDIVWVGLGCPRQEFWMYRQKGRIQAAWMMGVGQAFAQIAGAQSPAPTWMQSCGLEWLYRLCREPRRLAKRYLVTNFLFVYYLILERLGFKRFES